MSSFTKEELTEIIAQAIELADERREAKEKAALAQKEADLNRLVGYEEHTLKNGSPDTFRNSWCAFGAYCKLLFLSKKKIESDIITTRMVSYLAASLCRLFKWACWVGVLAFIGVTIASWCQVPELAEWPWPLIFLSIPCFCFGQLFRIMAVEVEKNTDKSYLIDILSAFVSIVALVVSLVALVD